MSPAVIVGVGIDGMAFLQVYFLFFHSSCEKYDASMQLDLN